MLLKQPLEQPSPKPVGTLQKESSVRKKPKFGCESSKLTLETRGLMADVMGYPKDSFGADFDRYSGTKQLDTKVDSGQAIIVAVAQLK